MRRKIFGLFIALGIMFWGSSALAVFDSGSTGIDGPLSFTANSGTQTIVLPPDGVLNYTTIDIPTGVTVVFQKNELNTPVYMLATDNVVISGTINISGGSANSEVGAKGGPGGSDGGFGGAIPLSGSRGYGPGAGNGGAYSNNRGIGGGYASGGITYGNERIYPLVGGSGGGGGGARPDAQGGGGGGGGGAIVIASSTSITINGSILANGGNGQNYGGYYDHNDGGAGSGGAIKLVSNVVSGNGNLSALGGSAESGGGYGRIRIETFTNNRTTTTNPAYTFGEPSSIFMPNPPNLSIVSINGSPVPAGAKGAFNQPDVSLPSTTVNPVQIEVTATNVPITTNIKVWATPQYGSSTSVNVTPTGTDQASTAVADINISTAYSTVLTAETTFTVQQAFYIDGEKVDKVYVASTLGGENETIYITESGKEVKADLLASLN